MLDFSNLKSKTPQLLKRIHSALFCLARKYAHLKTLERKQDTRHKIQLGGLVKKAGLGDEPTAILFGLLLDAAEALQGEQAQYKKDQWRIKGDMELTRHQKTASLEER